MVYARTLSEQTFTFQVSGMLWRNSLVMVDRETGTWWSHVTGEALEGPRLGTRLEVVPSTQTTWQEWRSHHPDTDLLAKESQVLDSHYRSYFDDPERVGLCRSRWLHEKMPGKTLVWGVRHGVHAAAVTDRSLAGDGVVTFELGGDPAFAILAPDGGVRAYLAGTGPDAVSLERAEDRTFRDRDSGSTWDPATGRAVAGPRSGATLEPLPVTRVFWFAWSSFFPNTRVVE